MHDHLIGRPRRQQLTTVPLMTGLSTLLATRRPFGFGGGFSRSWLGGCDELREFLASSRSKPIASCAGQLLDLRSIRSSTSTTTSRPASKIASASDRSTPQNSTAQSYVPPTN